MLPKAAFHDLTNWYSQSKIVNGFQYYTLNTIKLDMEINVLCLNTIKFFCKVQALQPVVSGR